MLARRQGTAGIPVSGEVVDSQVVVSAVVAGAAATAEPHAEIWETIGHLSR